MPITCTSRLRRTSRRKSSSGTKKNCASSPSASARRSTCASIRPCIPKRRWSFGAPGLPELPPVRVGDEFEVELLSTRLPTATSAAAVVNGRLIEVENAANAAGNAIKIRIIDVDGADILAEPRFPIGSAPAAGAAAGEGAGKKRRRRGGRGRKPLTAAEQQEELRELAEEAAKGLGSRPGPGHRHLDDRGSRCRRARRAQRRRAQTRHAGGRGRGRRRGPAGRRARPADERAPAARPRSRRARAHQRSAAASASPRDGSLPAGPRRPVWHRCRARRSRARWSANCPAKRSPATA